MQSVTLSCRALVNVARFADSGKGRRKPILECVHVEPGGNIVATDGKAILVWRNGATAPPAEPVNIRAQKALLALCRKASAETVIVDAEQRRATVFGSHNQELGAVALAGDDVTPDTENPFPAWRNVFSGRYVQIPAEPIPPFDPDLYAKFALTPNGRGQTVMPTLMSGTTAKEALLVTYAEEPDACGLLMPLQPSQASEREFPAWVLAEAPTGA